MCLSIDSNTNWNLHSLKTNADIILLEVPICSRLLVQYFYSVNGRIQCVSYLVGNLCDTGLTYSSYAVHI